MVDYRQSVGRAVALAVASFALFSLHDTFVKLLSHGYHSFQIVFFILLFALVPTSLMIAVSKEEASLRPRHPWLLTLRALAATLGTPSTFYAFNKLGLAETYSLLFTSPMIVTVLSIPILGERVGLKRGFAVVMAMVGVLIVLRPGFSDLNIGHACGLFSALTSATSAIIMRKISPEERSGTMIIYPMLANILTMGLLLPWVYQPMPIIDLGLTASCGVLSFIAQLLLVNAYRRASAVTIAPIQYSQLIWGVLASALLFNHFPDFWVFVGASIIVLSGLIILWRESTSGVSLFRPALLSRLMRPQAGIITTPERNSR